MATSICIALCAIVWIQIIKSDSVEQWDMYQINLNGPSGGNPFVDYQLSASFIFEGTGDNEPFEVDGFYDGDGIYRIRFMPNQIGTWSYTTKSNAASMNDKKGTFTTTTPSKNNHGPAAVNHKTNRSFIFANNEPYFQTGTTTYAWITQTPEIINNTLSTLKMVTAANVFNKVRMMIFPKWESWTHKEPEYYPYIGTPPNQWGNFDKFNVSFWKHLDWALQQLLSFEAETGNQLVADVMLFTPYDYGHWGFDCLGCPYPTYSTCHQQPDTYNTTNDIFYIKYVVSRIASYRHVWWSMANEFDDIKCKNKSIPNAFPTWDTLFKALIKYDPYRNPQKEKSIHNGRYMYNYSQPWTTHFSVQGHWSYTYQWFNNQYKVSKPVILDEVQYEGDLTAGWCQLNAPEETDRFWQAQSDGIYCGHSECYNINNVSSSDTAILWWNYGNILRGESWKRIGFFNNYMTNTTLHPRFDVMINKCLISKNTGTTCDVSQLYQANVYYLIHWTRLDNGYSMNVTIDVGNNDVYAISTVDYYNETITFEKNVKGPNIVYSATKTPFNIQIVNTKTKYHIV